MCVSESTPITSGGENSRMLVRNLSDKTPDACRSHCLSDVVGFAIIQWPQWRPRDPSRQSHVFHSDLETRNTVFGSNGGVWSQHFQLELPRQLVISFVEAALDLLTL